MRITPRKEEYAPIVTMLESGEYEDATALAKAIVVQAYTTLLSRDWWLTVVEMPADNPVRFAYGLSATETQARAYELGADFPRLVLPVTSAEGHIARMREVA